MTTPKQFAGQLRYQARQYKGGQAARGGNPPAKHWYEEIADCLDTQQDAIESLQRSNAEQAARIAELEASNKDYKTDNATMDETLRKIALLVDIIEFNGDYAEAVRVIVEKLDKLESQPAQSVPSGFVLVPIEPTEEMRSNGMAVIDLNEDEVVYIYEAMLTAAPKPEATEEKPAQIGVMGYARICAAVKQGMQPPAANAAQDVRNQALEEAAKVCDKMQKALGFGNTSSTCAYQIRALKTASPEGGA